jgi:sulfur carrier protein ThiS
VDRIQVTLIETGPDKGRRVVDLPPGSTVTDALAAASLRREMYLVSRRNEVVPDDEPLDDGDTLEVFRVVSGG